MTAARIDLFLYLKRASVDLERRVETEHFVLGAAPVVNLFRQVAEPIQLTHHQSEYRVVPDARRPKGLEVYSIDAVSASTPTGEEIDLHPFNAFRHERSEENRAFWQAVRRPAGFDDPASEMHLRFVDLGFEPTGAADWIVQTRTTCLNRDLPGRLPFGGGQPRLNFAEGDAPVAAINCLTAPTPTLRPALEKGAVWKLIAHLNLKPSEPHRRGRGFGGAARDPSVV